MILVEKTMQVARERLVTIGTDLRAAAAAQTMDDTGVGLLVVCGIGRRIARSPVC